MDHTAIAVTAMRVTMGAFFLGTGYNKLFVKEVRDEVQGLFKTLKVPTPLAKIIPWGEYLGGLGLLVGALTRTAALGEIAILLGAIALDVWPKDIVGKHPRNPFDWVAKTICTPETLMVLILGVLVLLGAGPLSLDQLANNYLAAHR